MVNIGALLMNMGGPRSLGEVAPFLRAVFSDGEVIRFPGGPALQGVWARAIAAFRAPGARRRYAAIGGASPLLSWTRRQADGLSERLGGRPVEVAMRYGEPRADEAVRLLAEAGCRRIAVLPLYPQECRATTGTSLAEARRAIAGHGGGLEAIEVRSFHDHPLYVRAVAGRIREGLAEIPERSRPGAVVLFSAHGVPVSLAESGDPYVGQVRETVELVVRELGQEIGDHSLSFQSRAGPVRWIGPSTEEVVARLGREGAGAVLAVPISFVSDHIETLHEVDVELAEVAARAGIRLFRRAPSLNDCPGFLEALRAVVEDALARVALH